MIRHVVLMRFSDPADAPLAKERLDQLPAQIPTLLTMDVGLDVIGSEASYHLVLVSTHEDLEGLAGYQSHIAHEEFLAWVRPRLGTRAVVDAEF